MSDFFGHMFAVLPARLPRLATLMVDPKQQGYLTLAQNARDTNLNKPLSL